MFQCKTYLNTCLVRLLVEVDMFSVIPIMDWKMKLKLFFDIKCHYSLMKCLHNNNTQNDTIWCHLYFFLPHLVSNVKLHLTNVTLNM